MGARGLKAIVVDDSGAERPTLVDPERFDKARKTLVEGLKTHPVTGSGLPSFGTAILVNIINEAGALPTRNFSLGRFDRAEAISGETLAKNCDERGGRHEHACMTGCVVHCSNVYVDKAGEYWPRGNVSRQHAVAAGIIVLGDERDGFRFAKVIGEIARPNRIPPALGPQNFASGASVVMAAAYFFHSSR